MIRAIALAVFWLVASAASAQLTITVDPIHSPTHGFQWVSMEATLHVANPTQRAITLRVDVLELTDETGAVQLVRGMLVARPNGTPARTLSIAPGERVDVAVSAPSTASVQIGDHTAYRQAFVLHVGGRTQRLERAGVFQFRPFRDPYY